MLRPLISSGRLLGRPSAPPRLVTPDDDVLTVLQEMARMGEAKRYTIVSYPSTDTATTDKP